MDLKCTQLHQEPYPATYRADRHTQRFPQQVRGQVEEKVLGSEHRRAERAGEKKGKKWFSKILLHVLQQHLCLTAARHNPLRHSLPTLAAPRAPSVLPQAGGSQDGCPGSSLLPELALGDSWRREECAPISWVRETISLYIKLRALI